MTTIRELVRAAVAYRDADTYGVVHGTRQPLLDAADTLDTSGEVLLSRATVEQLVAGPGELWRNLDACKAAMEDARAALKEQS